MQKYNSIANKNAWQEGGWRWFYKNQQMCVHHAPIPSTIRNKGGKERIFF